MKAGIASTEAAIVEANLRVAMGSYSLVGGGSDIQEHDGLAMTSCGFDSAVFNAAMPTHGEVDQSALEAMIGTARQHYGPRKLGWTFWLCHCLLRPETAEARTEIFRAHGMHPIAHPPGMFTEKLAGQPRPVPAILFRRVADEASRLEFAHLSSMIFSLPFAIARRIYGGEGFWTGAITGWVGYVEGKAVSVVTVVIGSGAAGVYSLGTLPGYEGKGYGEAILRHALQAARQESGTEVTVLQTTRQGMKLYLKLGYRVVTDFSIFLSDGCKVV
jgi:GNAT superfamily N-acetyltransferase